jgi:hypothetical protein
VALRLLTECTPQLLTDAVVRIIISFLTEPLLLSIISLLGASSDLLCFLQRISTALLVDQQTTDKQFIGSTRNIRTFTCTVVQWRCYKQCNLYLLHKTFRGKKSIKIYCKHTWSGNKVRELATVCLPWQHWTKTLVRFDDVDISAFHSCVVDLWQSFSEWHLLLSACVLVCRRENVGA